MFDIRVWDPELSAWVLVAWRDTEEAARGIARGLWRAGAAGIQIVDRTPRVVVEEKHPVRSKRSGGGTGGPEHERQGSNHRRTR